MRLTLDRVRAGLMATGIPLMTCPKSTAPQYPRNPEQLGSPIALADGTGRDRLPGGVPRNREGQARPGRDVRAFWRGGKLIGCSGRKSARHGMMQSLARRPADEIFPNAGRIGHAEQKEVITENPVLAESAGGCAGDPIAKPLGACHFQGIHRPKPAALRRGPESGDQASR